jgi:hypothetical protein
MYRRRSFLSSLAAASSLTLSVLGPAALAAPPSARDARQAQYDSMGREVLGADGSRRFIDRQELPPQRQPTADVAVSASAPAQDVSPESYGPAVLSGGLSVSREWYRATFGVGIGATGLTVADLDANGTQEVIAAAGAAGFAANTFWYIVSQQGSGYAQTWVSAPTPSAIHSLRVAQLDANAPLEVLVGVGNQVQVYDGSTKTLQRTLTLPTSAPKGLTVADVDANGTRELVFCDSSNLYILDLASGTVQYTGAGQGGKDLAVANVDGDAALEIIVANGTAAGPVVDGLSRTVQWSNASGFGDIVRAGDLDGDGLAEIVAGSTWNTGLRVYNGDTQSLAYSVPVFNLAAVRIADVEGDGPLELLYGDAQWGSVHVLTGGTGVQKFALSNPEHGVTDIAVGNVDGDAAKEILWGAGYSSTGEDHLYVADAVTRTRDWESLDITGPFYALSAGDVDADGSKELLYGTFESDSGYSDGLFFIHDATTKALEYQSPPPTGTNWTGLWRIRTANVDADAQQEVFITTSQTYDGMIICYDGLTHAEQWRTSLNDVSIRGMQLADVDGDGSLEVVASVGIETTGAAGAFVYVYDAATGALEWQSPALSGSWQQLSLLRVANVDADAAQELVVAHLTGGLWIIDASTHDVQLATASLNISALDTVDLDGDGSAEILIGTTGGAVQELDAATGAVKRTVFTSSGQINGLTVVDFLSDGVKDYAFASGDQLRIVDGATLTEQWASGVIGTGVGAQDGLFAANIDGDSSLEVVVNTGQIGLMVYQVSAAGVPMAAYDAALRVPRCSTPGAGCDSGLLLLGRGNVGPEPNAPNTLSGSCADGNAGSFHSDESLDRIRVVSVDGSPLAPGKTVRIEATAWVWVSPTADHLDLYYAANANAPVWQYITTITPSAAGAQTLSATYVLPAGSLQAVRARFRYGGSPAACGVDVFNDHDDLAFAVQ